MSKEYNKTLIALWPTKSGHFKSMPIDARSFDQVHGAVQEVELGGVFIVKKLSEEARAKFKNPATAPTHFLEYISKQSVEEFEAEGKAYRESQGSGL